MITTRRSRQTAVWKISVMSLMLLGEGISFSLPVSPPSQSSSAVPPSSLNPQQATGRRLFMQNCSYCHLLQNDNPKSTQKGSAIGGDLKGLFKGENPMTDQAVQAIILRGFPKRMPGFQYGLKLEEIDHI